MKRKIMKLVTVMLLLITLTMVNLIYVGVGFVSLAAERVSTNHRNIEYTAELKSENLLTLNVTVKNEGYFNGEITLENSNFTLKNSSSEFVNKIEGNKITLNQINAGTTASFDVEIEPIRDENLDVGLLTAVSNLKLTGIYKDSTQKDINIEATREVELQYSESNNEENIENTAQIITNKVITKEGQEKRIVQLSINMGLKENNYPIKEINTNITLPKTKEMLEVVSKANFNTMTHFEYNYNENTIALKFTNEPNSENKILWKKSGCENVILTLVCNKDENLENVKLPIEQTVKLYNDKEIKLSNTVEIGNEEKDSLVQVSTSPVESTIYKGKIDASLDRSFETKTKIQVNLAKVQNSISIKEDESYYNLVDGNTASSNIIYNRTTISKDSFDKILGPNGTITILSQNGEVLSEINSSTPIDENRNIVVDYTGKEQSSLEIKMSTPVEEGDLIFTHTKTIKAAEEEEEIAKEAKEIVSNVTVNYSTGAIANSEVKIKLEDAKTDARLEVNKETLSTIVSNDLEIRGILKANQEQFNLYENPKITFELPEPVEDVTINSIDLVYENELTIANYVTDGRTITVELEGKQTKYKDNSIEGAILVINATAKVNRKVATQDGKIVMTVYNKEEIATFEKDIKVVAPTDITVIHSISNLGIETIGQEEKIVASLQRGTKATDLQTRIEIINNNENTMENVKVLGTFPTKSEKNNIDSTITKGIELQGVEGAKVYYTENENATNDVQNSENRWQENIADGTTVRKFLIEIPLMETGKDIQATYTTNIPANLEYNKNASQDYVVDYQNALTKSTNQMKATEINLETGVGPILETKLTTSVAGTELENNGTVKNGEVIKYKIEVSNVGSVDIDNVAVRGTVPEGTTLVKPKDKFEYTGSSYYDELKNKTYEDTIESLKVGEVTTKEYEVRVNNNTQSGTNLVNKSSITYGDVTKESEESNLITTNGNIRVTVKRVTDRDVDLYEAGAIQYFAIIENISDEKQDDIMVKTNLPETLEVSRLNLITNMDTNDDIQSANPEDAESKEIVEVTEEELTSNESADNSTEELIDYQSEINIGSLEPGQNKVLSYDMKIKKVNDFQTLDFSVIAKVGEEEYRSNSIADNVRKVDIALSMTAEPEGDYLKAGDTLKYIIRVKNNGSQDVNGLVIKDEVPSSLTVNKVTFDGEEIAELKENNNIEITANISAGTESTIEIETVVNYSEGRTEAEAITNIANAELLTETVATTTEITYIIEANESQGESGETGEQPNEDNNVPDNDIANGKGIITGLAWFDENANGQKDNNENYISEVKVRLYNAETNNFVKKQDGSVLEVTTNDNGVYILDHIGNGKYIVIFDYDNSAYALTKYKVEGVSEANNSDAMMKDISIDGENKKLASTDILELDNSNISDINVGYIKVQSFDLKLEKFVSRIIIQDSTGSTVREYNDETLARAELDAKRVNGATTLIEYKIRVSNIGEVAGYARRIADYMPNDLKFSSELNKDWYQTQDGLYNESLANDMIQPGETRELTLTLTKNMTENNVGLINNTAEIDESYNELGVADINSTPGNRINGENDMGSADVLLGIRTGGAVYIGITIGMIAVLGVITFVIIRKTRKNKKEI